MLPITANARLRRNEEGLVKRLGRCVVLFEGKRYLRGEQEKVHKIKYMGRGRGGDHGIIVVQLLLFTVEGGGGAAKSS